MGAKQEFLDKITAGKIEGKDITLMLAAIQEIAAESEDMQELLEDLKEEDENFRINFSLPDTKREAYLLIENGKLITDKGLLDNPMISIIMDETVALSIIQGKLGIVQAYSEGKIKAEGNLMKAAALGLLLNICGDELGLL